MSDLRLALLVEAIDQFSAPLRRMSEAVAGPARAARAALGRGFEQLQRFGESYAGLAASVGAGLEVKGVLDDEDAFARIGIDAGASAEQVEHLKKTIFGASEKWGVPLQELQAGFRNMFDLVGLDKAEEGVDALAMSIQRLGGRDIGPQLGLLFADLEKFGGLKGPQDLIQAMATLRAQVGPHSAWLGDFARIAPEVLNAYKEQGHTGEGAMRDIGAIFAALRATVQRPQQAGTGLMELLAAVYNPKTAATLSGFNIPVLGKSAQEREANLRNMRRAPIPEWLPQLVAALRQADVGLALDGVVPGLHSLLLNFDPSQLEAALKITGDAAKIQQEAAAAAGTSSSALNSLATSIKEVSEAYLGWPLKELTDLLRDFPGVVTFVVTALGGFAILGLVSGWMVQAKDAVVGLASVLWSAIGFIGEFATAMRLGFTVFEGLSLAAAANPVGALVIAAGALAVAGIAIYENWSKVRDLFASLGGGGDFSALGAPATRRDWGWRDLLPGSGDYFAAGAFAPPRPGIADRQSDAAPADGARSQTDINIKIDGLPAGARVGANRSDPGSHVNLDFGYAMAVP